MRTILHPTDFSELSKKVLQAALARIDAEGGRLILLHVREPQEVVEGEFGMIPPEPEPPDEKVLADLEALAPPNHAADIEVVLARGMVAEEITRVAWDRHCDLIMMASHGHDGFFSRLLHANIAEQVARQATCEVVALTEQELEPAFS